MAVGPLYLHSRYVQLTTHRGRDGPSHALSHTACRTFRDGCRCRSKCTLVLELKSLIKGERLATLHDETWIRCAVPWIELEMSGRKHHENTSLRVYEKHTSRPPLLLLRSVAYSEKSYHHGLSCTSKHRSLAGVVPEPFPTQMQGKRPHSTSGLVAVLSIKHEVSSPTS